MQLYIVLVVMVNNNRDEGKSQTHIVMKKTADSQQCINQPSILITSFIKLKPKN